MEKYAVVATGADKERLKQALSLAIILSVKYNCSISIVVPKLDLRNSLLNKVIGSDFLNSLIKNRPDTTLEGRSVKLYSRRTYRPYGERNIVLGLWGGIDMLEKIDQASEAKAIVALSWVEEDLKSWVKNTSVKLVNSS